METIVEILFKNGRAPPLAYNSVVLKFGAQENPHKVLETLLKDIKVHPLVDNSLKIAAQKGPSKL